MDKLLNLQEIAEFAQVPLWRIRRAIKTGELDFYDFSPPGSIRPKMRRCTKEAVQKWIESLSQQKEPQIL